MSIVTFVLGHSGSGKTASLRNLDPSKTRIIQVRKKPLSFKTKNFFYKTKDNNGNVIVRDTSDGILSIFNRLSNNTEIVVIDDFQYLMAMEFMGGIIDTKNSLRGYDRFNSIAKNAYLVIDTATRDPSNRRYYFLSHLQEDENGRESIKTIGKLLDSKIVLEGLVTIVLKSAIEFDEYVFFTRNSGKDTVKTPMGMFEKQTIPNDLDFVDKEICKYYSIEQIENSLTTDGDKQNVK